MALKHIQNWLLLSKFFYLKNHKHLMLVVFLFPALAYCQIANYISNGGFENNYSCNFPNLISSSKFWLSIDSSSYAGDYFNSCSGLANVPVNGYGYQKPKSGNAYALNTLYCMTSQCMSNNVRRGYLKNRLKQNLMSGKTYCAKFYINVSDNSTYGIDAIGIYFGNGTIDTITKCTIPLYYISPQVQNTNSNVIIDTMTWTLITGTFVANGSEKYALIGNFKNDAAVTSSLVNSTNLPAVFSNILYDDVSCIALDLPAYAGPDIWGIPNNTVYIGRPQDVGIDEACMWYKLPNITTAIDTAAGTTLTVGLTTNTYVVKQDICGNIKWDTVVVHASGTGLNEGDYIKNSVTVYPNPASDILNIEFNLGQENSFNGVIIYNSLGQMVREEEIAIKNRSASISTINLLNGVYYLSLKSDKLTTVSKRFTISR
jgi:hypothetical protein